MFRYLDTAYIQVDVETNYVRVTIKGKIFQISLNEEVKISESVVQRSQITGELLIRMPKLNVKETLMQKLGKIVICSTLSTFVKIYLLCFS